MQINYISGKPYCHNCYNKILFNNFSLKQTVSFRDVYNENQEKDYKNLEYSNLKYNDPRKRRLRHLSISNDCNLTKLFIDRKHPISIKELMDLTAVLGVEIGIFYNEKEKKIILHKSTIRGAKPGTGAGINYPKDNKNDLQIIIHSHPTFSCAKVQITNDIIDAGDKIEMVITLRGLILFYNETRCYNKKIDKINYSKDLVLSCDKTFLSEINTESKITEDFIKKLWSVKIAKKKIKLNENNTYDDAHFIKKYQGNSDPDESSSNAGNSLFSDSD